MSNVEILNQDLGGVDKRYKELLENHAHYFQTWWIKYLGAKTTDTEARQMIESIDWNKKNKAVGYLLNGLSKVAKDCPFSEAKDEFDNDQLKVGRLLDICGVLSGKNRSHMVSIVKKNLADPEFLNLKDKALVILQPKGNRVTTRVDLV